MQRNRLGKDIAYGVDIRLWEAYTGNHHMNYRYSKLGNDLFPLNIKSLLH